MMELLLTTQKPILVLGEGGSCKSNLIKDMCFSQIGQFAQHTFIEHVTCSHYTNSFTLKNAMEKNLETRKLENVDKHDDMGKTMNSAQYQ